jgi:glycerol-3-phosphate acyltransferase PlsY
MPSFQDACVRLPWSAAACLIAAAYLLGSVPFALLLGFLRGIDIRKAGSGNIGATNLTRLLGRRWGIPAFALDMLKGLLPVLAAGWIGSAAVRGGLLAAHAGIACGAAAILGHVFPIWLRFRGGKGVATAFGVVAGIAPLASAAAGIAWIALFFATRTVSIASIAAAAVFPAGVAFLFRSTPAAIAVPMDILAIAVGALIVFRHRSNIRRLLAGQEKRF